jgi:hypothetical protein
LANQVTAASIIGTTSCSPAWTLFVQADFFMEKGENPAMTRTPPLFRMPDLRRAVVGVRQAGEEIDRIEIDSDGRIIVFTKPRGPLQPDKAA